MTVVCVNAAFQKPVAVLSEDSLEERRAVQSGSLQRSSVQKGGSSAAHSLTASERAYSVAAAAGLILDMPPLRRIYSMPHNAISSLSSTAAGQAHRRVSCYVS